MWNRKIAIPTKSPLGTHDWSTSTSLRRGPKVRRGVLHTRRRPERLFIRQWEVSLHRWPRNANNSILIQCCIYSSISCAIFAPCAPFMYRLAFAKHRLFQCQKAVNCLFTWRIPSSSTLLYVLVLNYNWYWKALMVLFLTYFLSYLLPRTPPYLSYRSGGLHLSFCLHVASQTTYVFFYLFNKIENMFD